MSVTSPRLYGRRHLPALARRFGIAPDLVHEAEVVSLVLPFRVSEHVVSELIDWSAPESDPIFRLTFPRRGMLAATDFAALERALVRDAPRTELVALATRIHRGLNPDPSDQHRLNVPHFRGAPLPGVQHKYPDTVLYFPVEGQTCHSFCSYCFRWPQFVAGLDRFASADPEAVASYVRSHPGVTDVLLTGGDPLVMRASVLRRHVEPFLAPGLEHLTIRIGTKALAYHPGRLLDERDSDDLRSLLAEIAAKRSLAVMAHYSHPRELEPAPAREALARVLECGATVRCQAPVIRGVNDDAATWAELWSQQVRLGAFPYYMFVERDTGAHRYFKVPLARALAIHDEAIAAAPGLARTARGPVMSASVGKVLVAGRITSGREEAFVLKLIRSREPELAGRIEIARYDERAAWLDELVRHDARGGVPFGPALAQAA